LSAPVKRPRIRDSAAYAVAKAYDQVAAEYDDRFSSPVALAENELVKQWIQEDFKRGVQGSYPLVWDLGCGTGLFLDLFPEWPPDRYRGVDVSAEMLKRFHVKHPQHAALWADYSYLLEAEMTPYWRQGGVVVSLFGSPSYIRSAALLESITDRLLAPGGTACWMFLNRLRPAYILHEQAEPPTVLSPTELDQFVDCLAFWGWDAIRLRGLTEQAEVTELAHVRETPSLEGEYRVVSATKRENRR
jgi:SAM-dependent methyltransferase